MNINMNVTAIPYEHKEEENAWRENYLYYSWIKYFGVTFDN